jgi:hypothetical protein
MSGFIDRDRDVRGAHNEANNAATLYGGADAMTKVIEHGMGTSFGMTSQQAANSARGLPGSGALGHVGGALAALGLANDIHDMTQNGINADNGISATSNALGVGAWGAGAFGAAGGTAATVAAPLMAAGAAGLTLGSASNSFMSDMGWLGQNSDGTGRSWSDMAGDWGAAADEWAGGGTLGTVAGVGATLAGSLVGTAGTIATAPLVIGRGIARGASAVGSGIKRGVGALLSW